jgi:hypothetical protein
MASRRSPTRTSSGFYEWRRSGAPGTGFAPGHRIRRKRDGEDAVPVKKPSKPAKRVRYVLSADQRLRRLSLRKIAERRKKPKSQARSNRPVSEAAATDAPRVPDTPPVWWGSSRAIALAMTGLVTAAILIAAGLPGGTPGDDRSASRPAATPLLETESAAPAPDPPIAPATKPSKDSPADRSARTSPAVVEAKPSTVAATPESATGAGDETIVTLTGCLDLDKQTFRLKDASGSAAPKTRSWRSGFRKRASTIDVVDPGNTLSLRTHVGERVAATGTLDAGELRARSLRVVSYSCR